MKRKPWPFPMKVPSRKRIKAQRVRIKPWGLTALLALEQKMADAMKR